MADGVLSFSAHLGKSKTIGFCRSKDWVVAKASFSDTLPQDFSFDDTLKEMLLPTLHKSDDSAEACFSCLGIFEFVEQALHVRICIMILAVAVHGTEASRVDSRSIVESFYL